MSGGVRLVGAAVLLAALLPLNACITVSDWTPERQDLLSDTGYAGRADRPRISLKILKPNIMNVKIGLRGNPVYDAKFNYDANIVGITKDSLSRYFEIVDAGNETPAALVVLQQIEISGGCKGGCSQTVRFSAQVAMEYRGEEYDYERVTGFAKAEDSLSLFYPASFEPLHREASKGAYEAFIHDLVDHIDRKLVEIDVPVS